MEEFYNEFEIKREMNKISLETYSFNKVNVLDYALKEVMEDTKMRTHHLYCEHDAWHEMFENDREKFEELEEVAQRTGHSLHIQMNEYLQDAWYLEDELFAILEVKIIYAFKHFEINLKKLLAANYIDCITKGFNWQNFIEFTKSRKIQFKKISGYEEVNELRIVNNSLKHASGYDDSLNNILEFKDKDSIYYSDLEAFYERIKNFPNMFIQNLCSEINSDLYEFDENKLTLMAKEIALRMDKTTAKRMMEILENLYD